MDLHTKPFDDATLVKLKIFRGYIRQWLPVFLSRKTFPTINIFDFFAGPGIDKNGEKGSPLIVLDEIHEYIKSPTQPYCSEVQINIYLNEFNKVKYQNLVGLVEQHPLKQIKNIDIRIENKDFFEAFNLGLPKIKALTSTNLVILDQNGIKFVDTTIFSELVNSSSTDILFFVSSSTIKRFITEDAVKKYIALTIEDVDQVSTSDIHRYICNEYYRKLIPSTKNYFLAPFSIKKNPNIYGVIFGSAKLLGLEKFLSVCWALDEHTGEANYNIDNDRLRDSGGQLSFLPEDNVIKKQDVFKRTLIDLLRATTKTNLELYRFCLEAGFIPKHLFSILKDLQDKEEITVTDCKSGSKSRKGAFYLSWSEFKSSTPKVSVRLKDPP